MPQYTGSSNLGAQSIFQETWTASKAFAVDLPNFDQQDYRQRVGLVLIGQAITDFPTRVISVHKLFATGLLIRPPFPLPNLLYSMRIDWYIPGLLWVVNTF